MKNKITLISLSLAIFAAMAGMASAQIICDPTTGIGCDQIAVYKTGTSQLVTSFDIVPNGPAVPLTARFTFAELRPAPDDQHSFDYTVNVINDPTSTASPDDIDLTAIEVSCPPGSCATLPPRPMHWYQDTGLATEDINMLITSTGPVGATYEIVLQDVTTGTLFSFTMHSLQATNIPEFPTIVAPIASVLGLLLFFRYKQGKEEK